ncbi:hypothetical protein GLOTRDRAFT_60574 [Gloeophyllum trabeum ATCC 11539]|uniref:VHS domain-containing protein n=1 Tax=Gloeophyllum trabeum (strain ATCC 11539 / FP-39264 / Madison 617) TaxID=670483 RepID=S7RMU1_GLOTA|nr:uncharacterized protein GLOTRDRAFT_60574 [Gloeophyllum trabeum ATCC 11539]EPQ55785.1 hypothetical protein GLOTRDRAFT_60574 [Gloeophyllum trabeum ATCC 11539]
MKKLFTREKVPKAPKQPATARDAAYPAQTPLGEDHTFQYSPTPQYHEPTPGRNARRSTSDERWEVVQPFEDGSPTHLPRPPLLTDSRTSSLASLISSGTPPGATPRAVSPMNQPHPRQKSPPLSDREPQMLRKKPPNAGTGAAALGILKALDPHPEGPGYHDDTSNASDGQVKEEKKEKKGFWDRAGAGLRDMRDREKEKEKLRESHKNQDQGHELTRMIGWLTATGSEDWAYVLDACEKASANEVNAKEAAKALRREFKYAEPPAQLSSARLWAIMLRNCSDVFITQCSSRKFLDTLDEVITSPRTSPVVRERLVDILGAATYMTNGKESKSERDGFRALWRKVKPADKPDEGVPFDEDDAMFSPPASRRHSQFSVLQSPQIDIDVTPVVHSQPQSETVTPKSRKHKSSQKNRVIPPEEDMRRLFQECKVGRGNAALLSESLAFAKPEDLQEKDVIREFYYKCRASQELIYAQIPWASAGAERSRLAAAARDSANFPGTDEEPAAPTPEEQLLAALLEANEELQEALRLYDDLERVGLERQAEERSRKEVRMDRSKLNADEDGHSMYPASSPSQFAGGSSSHSPSPSPSPSPPSTHGFLPHGHRASITSPDFDHPHHSLAPPRSAPHGPRSPTLNIARSRTPSWERQSVAQSGRQSMLSVAELRRASQNGGRQSEDSSVDEEYATPVKPSAKALGKRRQVDADDSSTRFDPDDIFLEHRDRLNGSEDDLASDADDAELRRWHQPVHYVYDAAAERTEQRLKEGHLGLVNGVR